MTPTPLSNKKLATAASVEPQYEVTAHIKEWRDGKNGRFASADILSEGAPTQTASCSTTVNHQTPPTGEPFRAIIKKKANGNGYTIIDIIVEGLPAELFDVAAVVRRKKGIDLLLETTPQPNTPSVKVLLQSKLLNQLQIDNIEAGTEVRIDAIREATGYVVSKLHAPTVLDAFASLESPQIIIACVKNNWPGDHKEKKGCFVTYQAQGKVVTAKFWVMQAVLRGASIPATHAFDTNSTIEGNGNDGLLNDWQDTLRNGSPTDIGQLRIDRLEVQLEWIEAEQAWRMCRLCRPRALREPQGSEIIDWVEGTVGEATDDTQEQHTEGEFTSPSALSSTKTSPKGKEFVDVAFQDPRVGRGTARLYDKDKIPHAALSLGVQVIFSLVGNGKYWNIKCLHRSTPLVPEDAP